ncbi:MAG: FAD-dependent oxidoreductase [Roseburia sp.]
MDEPTHDGACAVNPFSHQGISKLLIPKPDRLKKVAVVGGGVAGLNAAIAAAQREHDVTLYEQKSKLGGQITITDEVSFKSELKECHEYLERQARKLSNLTIKLNTKATLDMIRESEVDVAIIAVGAKQKLSKIPGAEKGTQSFDAFHDPDRLGKKVVIIGGGHVGAELGLYLAEFGHQVTVVEQRDFFLLTCELSISVSLLQELENRNVEALHSTEAIEVLDAGVRVVSSQ